MTVLVACEFSGRVRDALISAGIDAISCDLLPTESPGPHITADVLIELGRGWSAIIAFPPCTFLARSGARHWHRRWREQADAIDFVRAIADAPVRALAIENPVGCLTQRWAPPTQYVCHSWFGETYTKKTCLWLRGLPPLMATFQAANPDPFIRRFPHSGAGDALQSAAWRRRARLPIGFAEAIASQWRSYL